MTSKLKCPFCQQELRQDYTGVMYCCNDDCEQSADWYGSPILWQALIQVKQDLEFFIEENDNSVTALIERTKELDKCQKDLEIATKALENIVSDYEVDASNGWLAANAKKALETIGKHKDDK